MIAYGKKGVNILIAAIAMSTAILSPAISQDNALAPLRTQFEREKTDLHALRRIIHSLNSVDTLYAPYFPVWSILDQTLRLKILDAFRGRRIRFDESADVYVVATPDTQDVVDILVGDQPYGRLYSKAVLDRNLRQDILNRNAYANDEQTPFRYKNTIPDTRSPQGREATPDWVSVSISLFGGEIRFGNDWSIVGRVGDDVLGYPFWSSGQAWLLVRYKSIALGTRLPVHGGLDDFALGLQTRMLNGSSGIAGEIKIELDATASHATQFTYSGIGGSFAIGRLGNRRDELLTPDLNRLYSISTVVEAHYAFDYQFDNARHHLSSKIGIGYHRVTLSKLDGADIVESGKPVGFVHLRVSLTYKNQKNDWFTLKGEFSRLAVFSAWAELVPRFVFAELKYAVVALREVQPWEHNSYVYGTIGVRFDF